MGNGNCFQSKEDADAGTSEADRYPSGEEQWEVTVTVPVVVVCVVDSSHPLTHPTHSLTHSLIALTLCSPSRAAATSLGWERCTLPPPCPSTDHAPCVTLHVWTVDSALSLSLDTRHPNQSTPTLDAVQVHIALLDRSLDSSESRHARRPLHGTALCGDTATAGAARHGPRCSLQGPARCQRNTNADLRVSEPR
jgi:hypothetical protein